MLRRASVAAVVPFVPALGVLAVLLLSLLWALFGAVLLVVGCPAAVSVAWLLGAAVCLSWLLVRLPLPVRRGLAAVFVAASWLFWVLVWLFFPRWLPGCPRVRSSWSLLSSRVLRGRVLRRRRASLGSPLPRFRRFVPFRRAWLWSSSCRCFVPVVLPLSSALRG